MPPNCHLSFCYIHDSVVDMRETSSFQSKVVSQTLFSEKIEVKETNGEWSHIATSDGYSGWIPSHSFTIGNCCYDTSVHISRLAAHLYDRKDIEYGPYQTLPYGSRLHILEVVDERWVKVRLPNDKECYIQKGDIAPQEGLQNKWELVSLSQRFLALPYTWGGRSSFGYDCSGFVQMLYQHLDICLPRDAKQQVLDPRFRTIELDCLAPGDLIFFGDVYKHIKHVGLCLNHESFIHATSRENQPWIRISHLSDFEWSGHAQAIYPYRLGRSLIDHC